MFNFRISSFFLSCVMAIGRCGVKHSTRFLLIVFSLFTSSYSLAYCFYAEQGSFNASHSSSTTGGTVACRAMMDAAQVPRGSNGYGALGSTGGNCYYYADPGGAIVYFGTWTRSGTPETTCAAEPPPDPVCPAGQFWDFESESCKYPEDEVCPVGSNWNPATNDCVCDGDGILSNSMGLRYCLAPADDDCSPESSDFAGYMEGKAVCPGRARCPSGFQPGFVGNPPEAVCIPAPETRDPSCDGTIGNFDGQTVCIPDFGENNPDCEDGGKQGTINGETRCIYDPKNDPRCGSGFTSGYAGTGAEMNHTCVPDDYKPQTCPPGQYAWNSATEGFACVTTSPTPPKDPNAPPTVGGTSTSTTTNKDAAGNVIGTSETETKLPDGALEITFPDLLQDQPNNNYKEELDEFGKSELDGAVDVSELSSEFLGQDGAFTQRGSLNQLTSFLKDHTIGNSANCSGSLDFFGYPVSCERFAKYHQVMGWFIFILTIQHIFSIIFRKDPN